MIHVLSQVCNQSGILDERHMHIKPVVLVQSRVLIDFSLKNKYAFF